MEAFLIQTVIRYILHGKNKNFRRHFYTLLMPCIKMASGHVKGKVFHVFS
jgi:hypothetical protein